MYRQHPYAGYGPGPRRGGSPPGPGTDRSRHVDGGHRRGRGRNRGASANFTAPREQPGYQPQRDSQYSEDPYFSQPPRNDLTQSAYSENGYGRDQGKHRETALLSIHEPGASSQLVKGQCVKHLHGASRNTGMVQISAEISIS